MRRGAAHSPRRSEPNGEPVLWQILCNDADLVATREKLHGNAQRSDPSADDDAVHGHVCWKLIVRGQEERAKLEFETWTPMPECEPARPGCSTLGRMCSEASLWHRARTVNDRPGLLVITQTSAQKSSTLFGREVS